MKTLKILSSALLLFVGFGLQAQQGIGTVTPNDNAALEIVSPDKGVLIPRISLISSSTLFSGATGTVSHTGMLVYNINKTASSTTGLTGEGVYQWRLPMGETDDTTQHYWFKMLTSEDIAPTNTGTVTHSTLRWDGQSWVENEQLLASSDQVTMTTALSVGSGASTLTLNDLGLYLITEGTVTVSATSLTVTGSTTFTSTVTLLSNVIDSYNSAGRVGEVLSATETGTRWINLSSNETIANITEPTATPTATIKILLVTPQNNSIAVTLAPSGVDEGEYPVGFSLKIRRTTEYSMTNSNTVLILPASGEDINGLTSGVKMNIGYQSVTLYNTGGGWVTID